MSTKGRKWKSQIAIVFPIFAILAAATASQLASLQSQTQASQGNQNRGQPKIRIEEDQLPLVDYNASEPISPVDATKRANKSKHYNGRHLKDSQSTPVSIVTSHWLVKMPALPVTISDAIVIGEVLEAKAHLSEDRAGVYSEFTLHVESILKNNGHIPLALNDLLMAEREGGRVRFPSGRVMTLVAEYQGTPLMGHKYIVFLRRGDDEPNNLILTAYELKESKVFPIDGRAIRDGQLLSQFARYDGANREQFLDEVCGAIMREAAPGSRK